jgi:hypothetical protein
MAGAGAQAFNPGVAFSGAPGGGFQIFIPFPSVVLQGLTDKAFEDLKNEVCTLIGSTLDDLREAE